MVTGKKNKEVTFEIVQEIATLATNSKGWSKELNYVSWNDGQPKFEIRCWDAEHTKAGKGVTFTEEELSALRYVLNELFEDK